MVFKLNETAGGLKHMSLAFVRVLAGRPRDFHVSRFPAGTQIATHLGKDIICRHCGYVKVSVELSEGWTMELCSAMPILKVTDPRLDEWKQNIPSDSGRLQLAAAKGIERNR